MSRLDPQGHSAATVHLTLFRSFCTLWLFAPGPNTP